MKAQIALFLTFIFLFTQTTLAQLEERNVDFTVAPAMISEGHIQISLEWLDQSDFRKKNMSIVDLPKVHEINPHNNQLIISKIAFIARKPFEQLSHSAINNASYIAKMLNSTYVRQKDSETWQVTNKVRAYQIPFKISFDFIVKEVSSVSLNQTLVNYFRDESSGIRGTEKERFLILDMMNFSQLMYRNYSVVYMKEISPRETMVVAGIIAGFDINKANNYFNFPPFSSTKSTMMGNLKSQVMHMAQQIQK